MTNQKERRKVPELRFLEFSEEWEINDFGDLVTNKSSKYVPNEHENLIDIELDSLESNTGRLLHTYQSSEQKSQKNVFNKNDVLYSKLRPYLNKFYFSQFKGVCSSEIWILNSKNKKKLNNLFIYYFIQTTRFSSIANKSAGSKMPRADWSLVENIKFIIPSLQEQQKIGEFFSKLDRQIELEEKKLALLEEQKKGYMQKLFSQELRFKDENGEEYPEWDKKKIKEILFEVNVKSTENNQYSIISSTNKGLVLQEEYFKKQIASSNTIGYKVLRKNQVVLSPQNLWMGNINTNFLFEIGLVSPSYKIFEINENYDTYFISQLLRIKKMFHHYKNASEQGASIVRRNLNLELFYQIEMNIPCIDEQKKISFIIKEYNKKIKLLNNKVNNLKSRKKHFINELLI